MCSQYVAVNVVSKGIATLVSLTKVQDMLLPGMKRCGKEIKTGRNTYLGSQCLPLFVANSILEYIISLGKEEQTNRKNIYTKKSPIASVVVRFIVIAVDICRYNATELNTHSNSCEYKSLQSVESQTYYCRKRQIHYENQRYWNSWMTSQR
jgi:hypothetical protein